MNIFDYEFIGIKLVITVFLLVMIYPKIKLTVRLLMIQTEPSSRLLDFIDSSLSKSNFPWISNTIFLLSYSFLFIVQQSNKVKFIEYDKSSFDLVGVYGFIIGILSMYGIYIGFLQFIVGDSDKVRYLGKSKIKYLADTSIWYQITQTKPFLVVLFLTIISPLLIINISGEIQSSLIYAWQACVILLLWIYIFLIGMSLQILRILFLINGKTDVGLEKIIENSIVTEYYKLFRKIYRSKFESEAKERFFSILAFDISQVDKQSIGFFLTKAFSKIAIEVGSKYGEFKSVRIEKHDYGEYKHYLYDDYKKFIIRKWGHLSTIKDNIDWENFKKLIELDMRILNCLVDETPKVYEKSDDNLRSRHIREEIDNIHNYLFDQLLEKAILDCRRIENLYDDIKNSTREIELKEINGVTPNLLNYYIEIEQYKWKKIAGNYLHSENQFKLPEFNRYSNNEWYSKSIFEYLIDYYSGLRDSILENEKLMNLVSSMNKEHRVAYYLYQIFYPDSSWTRNNIFFQKKLKDIFQFLLEEEGKELYTSAAKIVVGTHIKHRVTFNVLTIIYNDREKVIDSMLYFAQFECSRILPLKILFVQEALSYNNKYSSRIILVTQPTEENNMVLENLCMDFLQSIDKVPEITNCEGLTYTMEYLLKNTSLNTFRVVSNLRIKSLLYYSFVLEYKKETSTNDLFLEAMIHRDGEKSSYHFWNESLFTFFALKTIDNRCGKYFNDEYFIESFKLAGISFLDRLDVTLEEYTEIIYEKLKNAPNGKIGKASLRQIYDKLEKIIFE